MDEIWAFMTAATEFANANDWIHAHCWFGTSSAYFFAQSSR